MKAQPSGVVWVDARGREEATASSLWVTLSLFVDAARLLWGGLIHAVLSRRATSNHKVKETVALELSYVNSNLQLLKEELEELNSCMDVYQNER